jgi:hypothetical protein
MPPHKAPQPSPAERRAMIDWLEGQFAQLDATDPLCGLVARRVSRGEYANAVRDLFGLEWVAPADFPDDDTAWDLARSVPALPASLQERYEAAADNVLAAVDVRPFPDARAALTAVARRAFRRPLVGGEAATLTATLDQAHRSGMTKSAALKTALREVLTSPHFLHLIEPRAAGGDSGTDDAAGDVVLAGRLASFLWQSVPDDALVDLAEGDRLRPRLAEQVRRMLQDPRADRFAYAFADAWLDLHKLNGATHVTVDLRRAMRAETEQFVAGIMREDRVVLEFLDTDHTYVNEALAAIYGIRGISGADIRRIRLPAGSGRGGLLTQASILALTAPSGVPSPVQRGKWILDNMLDTPPPAPPTGLLEAFEELAHASGPGRTLRQRFAQHREPSSCGYCHTKIDGLGQALANFNASGAWQPIDEPVGLEPIVLPTGETLESVAELKQYLLDHRQQFLRAVAAKLLQFATGRSLRASDRAECAQIVTNLMPEPSFGRLVLAIVQSAPMQQHAREP